MKRKIFAFIFKNIENNKFKKKTFDVQIMSFAAKKKYFLTKFFIFFS